MFWQKDVVVSHKTALFISRVTICHLSCLLKIYYKKAIIYNKKAAHGMSLPVWRLFIALVVDCNIFCKNYWTVGGGTCAGNNWTNKEGASNRLSPGSMAV